VALTQLTWNGIAASPMATVPTSSLSPQAYYPTPIPGTATANTTATWQNRVTNNIFNGGSLGTSLGTSWWQAAATANSGPPNIAIGVDLGNPRSVSTVQANWLGASACPGSGTCVGFNAVTYTIWTSPDGITWTSRASIASFDPGGCTPGPCISSDTLTGAPVSNVRYIAYVLTAWNATTPNGGYGPAANFLSVR
jgi:F5/8 type C domain